MFFIDVFSRMISSSQRLILGALALFETANIRNGGKTCIFIINALCTLVLNLVQLLQGSSFVQREKIIFQQVLKINRLQTKRLRKGFKIRYRMGIFFDRVMRI